MPDLKRPELTHPELTQPIVEAYFALYNQPNIHGYSEDNLVTMLAHKLREKGLKVVTREPVTLRMDGHDVGEVVVDLVVNDQVVVVVKNVKRVTARMKEAAALRKSQGKYIVGLFLNFGDILPLVKRIPATYKPRSR